MKNKILPLLLAACLLLSLTACGGAPAASGQIRCDENGYPKEMEKDRNKVFELLDTYDASELVGVIVSKGRLIEAINEYPEYYYYGEMDGPEPHGYGAVFSAYGAPEMRPLCYAGVFKDGKASGYGFCMSDTMVYEADDNAFQSILAKHEFILSGRGFVYLAEGFGEQNPRICYDGEMKDSALCGHGRMWYIKENPTYEYPMFLLGGLMYEGELKDNQYHGEGTLYDEDGGIQYKGTFKKGAYDGKGILYNGDGSVRYKGAFKNGEIAD